MKDKVICADTGMFLIRLALGLVFAVHGWGKLQDMPGTIGFFASLGLPAACAYLVAWVEFVGGVAMIAGLWTKWAGILLAITMAVATYYMRGRGFPGGYEFPLSLFLISLGVAFAGPGSFTIHKLFGGK